MKSRFYIWFRPDGGSWERIDSFDDLLEGYRCYREYCLAGGGEYAFCRGSKARPE